MFSHLKKYKFELQQPLPPDFHDWFPQESRRWLRKVENWISSILLMLFMFYSIALLTYTTGMLCRLSVAMGILFGLIFCAFNISMLFHILSCWMKNLTPLPVIVALEYPLLPGPLCWIASLWWLFHFFLGLFFAFLSVHFNHPNTLYEKATVAMMVFGFSYASNGFLLIALRGFGADTKTIRKVWQHRILLDLVNSVLQLVILHYLGVFT